MNYTITANDLKDFKKVLSNGNIPITIIDENKIIVEVQNENEKENIFNFLSYYLIYKKIQTEVPKILQNNGLNKVEISAMMKMIIMEKGYINYLYVNEIILLKEYFKGNDILDIEAFQLFNMKKFKDELKRMIEIYMETDYQEFTETETMDEAFEELRLIALENGLIFEDFKTIHVFDGAGDFVLKNNKSEVINDEMFMHLFGSILQFEIGEDIDNKELLERFLGISMILKIFKSEKVVIHSCIDDSKKNSLISSLIESLSDVKIESCYGCTICQ